MGGGGIGEFWGSEFVKGARGGRGGVGELYELMGEL